MKKILIFVIFIFLSFNTAFASTDVDFGPYMRELQRRIKLNWQPPKEKVSQSVVTIFSIDKSGELLNERILKSSGNEEYDNIALQTLRSSAPFRPLPAKFTGNKVDVQFTFDYNVFGASIEKNASSPQNQQKTIKQPVEIKKTEKISKSFSLHNLIKKYKIDYEAIRAVALGIIILIIGLIFIPNANRK